MKNLTILIILLTVVWGCEDTPEPPTLVVVEQPQEDIDIDAIIDAKGTFEGIIDEAIESWFRADEKYKFKTVTIRATIENYVELDGMFEGVVWVFLENRRDYLFIMDVSHVPNWQDIFKIDRTATFTVRITNIGAPRVNRIQFHRFGNKGVQCVFLE